MIKVIQPPQDETKIPELGRWLYEGLKALDINLDIEGFVIAWTGGSTKMVVETDAENKIISAALLTIGKKWTDSRESAMILDIRGDRAKMIEYCTNLATAFNMGYMAYEAQEHEPGVLSRVHRIDL
jgi:hypothetical protein